MNIITCPYCGKKTLDDQSHCEHCGEPIETPESAANDSSTAAPDADVQAPPSADGPPADTKACPYCAETIKSAAIKCRYCGSDLTSPSENIPTKAMRACPTCDAPVEEGVTECPKCGDFVPDVLAPYPPAQEALTSGKPTFRLGRFIMLFVLWSVPGLIAGVIATPLYQGYQMANAEYHERIVMEVCMEDPDCQMPKMSSVGWGAYFVIVVGMMLVSKSVWRPKRASNR